MTEHIIQGRTSLLMIYTETIAIIPVMFQVIVKFNDFELIFVKDRTPRRIVEFVPSRFECARSVH